MENRLAKHLIDFGLTEKEARIYLSLLELETATAYEVSKHSGVNRSSAYVVLESLKRKGLAGISDDKKIRKYVASSPNFFSQLAYNNQQKYSQILSNIQSILPELNALNKNLIEKPKVRIFEGLDGLKNALMECLDNKEKILRAFSSGENLIKLVPDHLGLWALKRIELGIKVKGIYVDCKASRQLVETSPPVNYEIIYVPKKDYPATVDMIIYDDRVGYLIVEGERITSIFVEAKEIGSVMRGMFDMAFEEAKRLGGKLDRK